MRFLFFSGARSFAPNYAKKDQLSQFAPAWSRPLPDVTSDNVPAARQVAVNFFGIALGVNSHGLCGV
jgi:hypothetical protein